MSHNRAAVLVCGVVLAGIVALSAVNAATAEHPPRSERDRAAIEAAADSLTHEQIADAWTQLKLNNFRPMQEIRAAFPLPHRTTYEDGDGLVLVFDGHGDTCIDFVTRPMESIVSARRC